MQLFLNSKPYKIVQGDAASGRLSHAYLLITPDGDNLRQWLKELAKTVMGADSRTARLIDDEIHIDCRIVPAKDEKMTVSTVRDLLEDAYIKPVESDRKVFVLDRVQDMNIPSQNKLLKVLEEPPKNVCFILGATNEFAVLSTVKSRSKRLDLPSFRESEIEQYIRTMYPNRTDAREIAAVSGGVLCKAEQLAKSKSSLTETGEEAARLLASLSPASIPSESRKFSDREETLRFLALLRTVLHDVLVLKTGGRTLNSAAETSLLQRSVQRYDIAQLVFAQEKITETEKKLKFNAVPAFCMEALFIGILEGR